MARDPFAELATPSAGGLGSKFNGSRFTIGLLVILLLAFAFGFYMPLSGAHEMLVKEHETLNSSKGETTAQLEKTTAQLMDTQKERDEASGKLKTFEDAKSAADKKVEDLFNSAKDKLSAQLKSSLVSIEQRKDGAVVSIDDLALFRGHEVSVHPPGRKLLCGVGKAIKDLGASVAVRGSTVDSKVNNPILKKDFSNVWELSAARAVGAVRVLESCGIPGARLSAVGVGQHEEGKPANKKSEGRIRLQLTLSED